MTACRSPRSVHHGWGLVKRATGNWSWLPVRPPPKQQKTHTTFSSHPAGTIRQFLRECIGALASLLTGILHCGVTLAALAHQLRNGFTHGSPLAGDNRSIPKPCLSTPKHSPWNRYARLLAAVSSWTVSKFWCHAIAPPGWQRTPKTPQKTNKEGPIVKVVAPQKACSLPGCGPLGLGGCGWRPRFWSWTILLDAWKRQQ